MDESFKKARVLVAPLNWGMGHATRCIPVIEELEKHECDIILSASGTGKLILADHFPNLPFVHIPDIEIRYGSHLPIWLMMLNQSAKFFRTYRKEHYQLSKIITNEKITHVISDNRYGLYSKKVKCAIITHQINIQTPGFLSIFKPIVNTISKRFINKFSECWIPDNEEINLSGKLSKSDSIKIPVYLSGILSRFKRSAEISQKKYDAVAVLSGPEPSRSAFEKKIIEELGVYGKPSLLVRGVSNSLDPVFNIPDNIDVRSLITDAELIKILHPDTLYIGRSGYSTLMDLLVLDHSKVLFVPTPGQTEQEYLARNISAKFGFPFQLQNELTIPDKVNGSWKNNLHMQTSLPKLVTNFLRSNKS